MILRSCSEIHCEIQLDFPSELGAFVSFMNRVDPYVDLTGVHYVSLIFLRDPLTAKNARLNSEAHSAETQVDLQQGFVDDWQDWSL